MRRMLIGILVFALSTTQSVAQDKDAKLLVDAWDAAYLQGTKSGHVHTLVEEIERDGQKVLRSVLEFRLNVKRSGDVLELGMDTGTYETPEGKVVGVFMKQRLGKKQTASITGSVAGKLLKLTLNESKALKPAPWKDDVIGVYGQQKLFRDKNLKPGDRFEFNSFEPTINLVVTQKVEAKDFEEVELFNGKLKQKLLRVETRTNKVQNVQLPPLFTWLNEDLMPVRMQMEIPGIGTLILYRTSKQVATAPGAVANLTDVGLGQYVKLNRAIPRPHEATAAVYRITVRGDEDPKSAFSSDRRQSIKNLKGETFELHVNAGRAVSEAKDEKPGAELTGSSQFINCADVKVKELARRAVGSEKDPWNKALRIERWVHTNMRPVNYEALATADHVARTLEGDCTEYAMLAAAMCRAEGVPSRTAVGLIYANVRTGPVFAFHMWTEVWIDGQWRPIDATLGKGFVGATHLKISDQSWHEERTMTPLLPVVRLLGRVNIEVLSVEHER